MCQQHSLHQRQQTNTQHRATLVLLPSLLGDVTGDTKVQNSEILDQEGIRVKTAHDHEAFALVDVIGGLLQAVTKTLQWEIGLVDLITIESLLCGYVSFWNRLRGQVGYL